MKIGREYSSDRVTPKDFEQLAEEAGFARLLVRRNVPELAEALISALRRMEFLNPTAEAVAAMIRTRCMKVLERFR